MAWYGLAGMVIAEYFKEVIIMTTAEKNMEQRLRRALYKAGYQLHRSDGEYMIVDYYINGLVSSGLDLEGVESFVSTNCD